MDYTLLLADQMPTLPQSAILVPLYRLYQHAHRFFWYNFDKFYPDKAPRDSIYGAAMEDQDGVMAIMGSNHHKCHVIVTFHLKMIGPKAPRKGETEVATAAKEAAADMIPTRLCPSALGWLLPPMIGGNFPISILAEAQTKGMKTRRVLRTTACENIDIKLALQGLPAELPIEDGMLQIFTALKGEKPK